MSGYNLVTQQYPPHPKRELTRDLFLYVDGLNGKDANEGTRNRPLKTWIEAYTRANRFYFLYANIYIFLSNHTGAGFEITTIGPHTGPGRVWTVGGWRYRDDNGAWHIDTDNAEINIIYTGTALAGSSSTQIAAVGLPLDGYRDFFIAILDGASAGDIRMIADCVPTIISPDAEFTNAIAQGDHYVIFTPVATVIETLSGTRDFLISEDAFGQGTPNGLLAESCTVGGCVNLVNLLLGWTNNASWGWAFRNSTIKFYGVLIPNANMTNLVGTGRAQAGFSGFGINMAPAAREPYLDFGLPSETSWLGWGISFIDNLWGSEFILGDIEFKGYLNSNTFIVPNDNAKVTLLGGATRWIHVRNEEYLIGPARTMLEIFGAVNARYLLYTDSINHPALQVDESTYASLAGCDLRNVSGDGILCGQDSLVMINRSGRFTVSGLNGRIGVRCRDGGIFVCNEALQIYGDSDNDFSVDDGATTHAAAELTDGLTFTDLIPSSVVFSALNAYATVSGGSLVGASITPATQRVNYLGFAGISSALQNYSGTVTIPAGATFALIGIAEYNAAGTEWPTITLDGQAVTPVGITSRGGASTTTMVFRVSGFATGDRTFSSNWSIPVSNGVRYMIAFFGGVDLVSPIAMASTVEVGGPWEITLTSAALPTSDGSAVVAFASGVTRGSCNMNLGGQIEIDSGNYNNGSLIIDYGFGYRSNIAAMSGSGSQVKRRDV